MTTPDGLAKAELFGQLESTKVKYDNDSGGLAWFSGQRCYIKLSAIGSSDVTLRLQTSEDDLCDYEIKAGKSIVVDVTDFVAAIMADGDEALKIWEVSPNPFYLYTFYLTIWEADAADPKTMAMPYAGSALSGVLQLPPYVQYAMKDAKLCDAESGEYDYEVLRSKGAFYFDPDGDAEAAALVDIEATKYSTMTGEQACTKPTLWYYSQVGAKVKCWQTTLRAIPCDREGRILYWRSRFGNVKKGVWLMRNKTDGVADSVALATGSAEILTAKTAAQSAEFYLPDLCAGDMWYYSDILTSPYVYFLNKNGEKQYLSITTSSATMPNGTAVEELSFTAEVSRQEVFNV